MEAVALLISMAVFLPSVIMSLPMSGGDGTLVDMQQISLRSFGGKWLSVVNQDDTLQAVSSEPSWWETFIVHRVNDRQIQLLSLKNGYWLQLAGGGAAVSATASYIPSGWETFNVRHVNKDSIQLQAFTGQWLSATEDGFGSILATASEPSGWETFTVRKVDYVRPQRSLLEDGSTLFLQAASRQFLSVKADSANAISADATKPYEWEMFRVKRVNDHQVQLLSLKTQLWLSAAGGGGREVMASADQPSGWETFTVRQPNTLQVQLQAFGKQWLSATRNGGGAIKAVASSPSQWETFYAIRSNEYPAKGACLGSWFVPEMSWMVPTLNAGVGANSLSDFCSKLGRQECSKRMDKHRAGFISQADFVFLAAHGFKLLRVPIGYWDVMNDPYNMYPYQTWQYLDEAFRWARQLGMQLLVDLHGAPGSQNGAEHSGQVAKPNWKTSRNRQYTLDVLEGLAKRYGSDPALYGIEVLNEPSCWFQGGEDYHAELIKFYPQAYQVIRKHSDCYVVYNDICPENGDIMTWPGRFDATAGFVSTIQDLHLYQAYDSKLSLDEHVQDVYDTWGNSELPQLCVRHPDHLCIIGEFSFALPMNIPQSAQANGQLGTAELRAWQQGGGVAGYMFWSYKFDHHDFGWELRTIIGTPNMWSNNIWKSWPAATVTWAKVWSKITAEIKSPAKRNQKCWQSPRGTDAGQLHCSPVPYK